MKKIKIFDTTLRDGEQSPGCSMTIEKKIEIAKKLDEMGVDVIEAGFAASNNKDFEAIKEIAKVVKNATVVSLARCNKNDIDRAYESIKEAAHPKIHTFIATSDIHMKYKLKMTREEVLDKVRECVSYAKSKCNEIEFSLEDATRTDKDFACKVIDAAIESGATTINIPDTVGYTVPCDYTEFLMYIKKHSRIDEVEMSVHCHNDLGLATANSLTAVRCGATQIECTVNGIGERAGNTALEEVVACLKTRKDIFDAYTDINTKMIKSISNLVIEATGSFVQNNKAIVGANAFKHEAGIHQAGVINNSQTYEVMNKEDYGIYEDSIVIGIHSGKNAVMDKIKKMNKNPNKYDIDSIMQQIKEFFEYNKEIKDEEFIKIIEQNTKKTYIKVS